MDNTTDRTDRPEDVHRQAVQTLFSLLDSICEGAMTVDRDARIVWMNEKYAVLLGLENMEAALGREVEEVIPNSLMRQVVQQERPILLDIMQFGERWFVVTRLPLRDESGAVTGAVGFVLYDRPDYLKPLVSKFTTLQSELARAHRELAKHRRAKYSFSQFVGSSPATLEVKRQARRAAGLDSTVILFGETGTGKELLAQAIHAASARADKPFVGVNVAAIPETLLEAEFFGVARGAYTGADAKGRPGKLAIADGGTLFLDEVGDMPLSLQVKLLRALQEKEIEAVGSNEVHRIDVRVIAATSHDLERRVAEGAFRADLFYRLNVIPISIPPFRQRLSDLPMLAEVMLEQIAVSAGAVPYELSPDALDVLAAHTWPGNVRELRNVLERVSALCEGSRLTASDVANVLPGGDGVRGGTMPNAAAVRTLGDATAEAERSAIRAALHVAGGNKSEAAKLLGISRAKLYDKIGRLGEMS